MQDTGFVKQQEKEQELLVCFSVLCRVYYVCDTGCYLGIFGSGLLPS
jgi:hypothetical protein